MVTDYLGWMFDRREVVYAVPAPQQIGKLQKLLALPRIQLDSDRACELGQFRTFGTGATTADWRQAAMRPRSPEARLSRFRWTNSNDIAAGVMPDMRAAWPTVSGR